jgi:hypothetical protein
MRSIVALGSHAHGPLGIERHGYMNTVNAYTPRAVTVTNAGPSSLSCGKECIRDSEVVDFCIVSSTQDDVRLRPVPRDRVLLTSKVTS